MSVQLILYPQNYNGQYSFTSTPVLNQYVADGNFNSGIFSATSTTNNKPSNYALTNSGAISAWKSFYSTGGTFASTSAPTVTTNLNLTASGSATSSSGIYQKISNLTIGSCYEVKVTISTGNSAGVLYLGNTFNTTWTLAGFPFANLGGTTHSWVSSAGTKTYQITANSTEEVLVLDYRASNGTTLVISNISITECPASASQVFTDLADGQVICDLYEEEAIPLSLSIDDFKNVAEKTQSYSKDFHLPNTKRNNKILGHIFEVTRTTGLSFNPYVKTKAILKEDSYTLFEGFMQLIDINDKEGEISYNVNLFSEPVTLAEVLKEKDFNDLSFEELDHEYTKTNIENSWAGNLALDNALPSGSYAGSGSTTGVLKYPLCDWTSGKNLDATNVVQFNRLEDAFRPFVKVKYLIDRIINEAEFKYTSDFFNTTHFGKLFMDFNWGADIVHNVNPVNSHYSLRLIDSSHLTGGTWNTLSPDSIALGGFTLGYYGTFNTSNNQFEETTNGTTYDISFAIQLKNTTGTAEIVNVRWLKTDTSASSTSNHEYRTLTVPANSRILYSGNFMVTLDDTDTLKAQCYPTNSSAIKESTSGSSTYTAFHWCIALRSSTGIDFDTKIKNLRGEMNQWEFLKGIFTMFNLVVVKEEDILRIEPYSDIFLTNTNSTQYNWTDKVDISEINLKPLDLKKKVIFSYEEDEDDYAIGVYKKATSGYLYGTKQIDGSTAIGNQSSILTGEEEIIATPFAPTIIKPIFDSYDNDFIVPTIYSGNDDGTQFEGFENAPRIMYDIQTVNLGTGKFSAPLINPEFNGKMEFLQFGHLNEIPVTSSTKDINFGECQLFDPLTNIVSDNLFNTYYFPYYNELYSPDTRIMTMKVNLTPSDIQNFKFYDTVVIKNREYRVNKIEYKPNTLAKVEFILIP